MLLGVLVAVAIVGAVVGAIALLVRGGRGAMDFAPRNLVRVYLYVASMAGIIVLVVGLSGLLTVGFAAVFGNGFVYGESTYPVPAACPPAAEPGVKCPPDQRSFAEQRVRELDRRRADDLIRGITFTVFGALFWGAHYVARRGVMGADEPTSGLRRGYLLLGTVIFGIATVILLPTGIYQALSYLILPLDQNGGFRQGTGDSLPGGLVTLPIWLIYLWFVVRDARATPALPPPAH